MEETLDFQEEYPQEAVEEVVEEAEEEGAAEEAFLLQHQPNQQVPMEETSSLATRHLYSMEIAPNQKNS